jgi:hypothetical protein
MSSAAAGVSFLIIIIDISIDEIPKSYRPA